MRTKSFLLIIVIFSIAFPTLSFPKAIPFKPAPVAPVGEQPVSITADVMTFNQATSEYLAQGDVEVTQGNQTLKADRVRYNLNTQDADAAGRVLLIQGEDTLASDAMKLNLKTQMGTVTNARIFVKEMNYRITGKEIERTGPDSYHVSDGIITTCNGDKPDWRITGKDIKIKLSGNAVIRDATFQVKNVPLAYFPFAAYPMVTKRQSGFLLPRLGYSSTSGTEADLAYYWAISPRTDSTFYLDLASIKGVGEGLEYRYLLKPDSEGKFYIYHTTESNKYFHHEYDDPLDRKQERLYVNYEGEYYFSPTFYTKALYNYVSDREVYKDYAEEIKRSESLAGQISFRSREKDESLIFLTKNWTNYSLTADLDYFENLLKRDDKTLQRFPQIVLSGRRQSILGSPAFFSFESSYNMLWRKVGMKGERFDLHPTFSLPFNFNNYVKFNTAVGLREISYFGLNRENFDENRTLFDVHAALSTNLFRVFTLPGKQIEKVRHSIEPEITYIYVPDRNQEELPSFDPLDDFDKQNTVVYSVTNRFTGRILNPDGSYSERELGFFKVGQGYNLSRPEGKSIPEEEKGHDFTDVFSELRFTLHPFIYCKSQLGYNPYDNNLRYYNIFVNFEDIRGDYLNVGYRYVREAIEGLQVRSKIKLSNTWDGFYEIRRNEFYHTNLDSIYGVGYNAQCWGMKFYYHEKPAQEGRKRENKFALLFTLTGLGEIASFSGSVD
jgi:LPS-assembly protein